MIAKPCNQRQSCIRAGKGDLHTDWGPARGQEMETGVSRGRMGRHKPRVAKGVGEGVGRSGLLCVLIGPPVQMRIWVFFRKCWEVWVGLADSNYRQGFISREGSRVRRQEWEGRREFLRASCGLTSIPGS